MSTWAARTTSSLPWLLPLGRSRKAPCSQCGGCTPVYHMFETFSRMLATRHLRHPTRRRTSVHVNDRRIGEAIRCIGATLWWDHFILERNKKNILWQGWHHHCMSYCPSPLNTINCDALLALPPHKSLQHTRMDMPHTAARFCVRTGTEATPRRQQ